jgi:hypothetical protein
LTKLRMKMTKWRKRCPRRQRGRTGQLFWGDLFVYICILFCLCHFIHLSQPTTTKKATTTRKATKANAASTKSKKTAVQTESQTQLTFPPAGRSARAAASRARGRMVVSLISLIVVPISIGWVFADSDFSVDGWRWWWWWLKWFSDELEIWLDQEPQNRLLSTNAN